jgi:TRAP-type C4-dicarboxylate transport system permease large subunit
MIIGLIPFGGANNYLLVAALLFMIAGEVMNQGKIAEKLIAFASPWWATSAAGWRMSTS